jgi:hypothetical protein
VSGKSDIHPNAVLEALLAKGGRSQRQGNLNKLHLICQARYETGSRDFSIGAVGRLCEAGGVLKGRALYNAASADYRALIEAWAAYAGPPAPKAPIPLASYEYLARIDDPAIRSIMQAVVAERDKLKAQLNIVKSQTRITVDRRPLGATVVSSPEREPVAVVTMSAQLTASERDALRKSISPQFLEQQGWQEGTHGEILNDRSRVLFEVGYARAVRKVLGE